MRVSASEIIKRDGSVLSSPVEYGSVAQPGIEQQVSTLRGAGSNPAGASICE